MVGSVKRRYGMVLRNEVVPHFGFGLGMAAMIFGVALTSLFIFNIMFLD